MSDTPETNPSQSPEDASAANETASSLHPPATEQSQTEAPPSLEDLLKAAELKAAEHHDAWLRAKAEGENIRRRAQEDITKASKFAVEKFADALLPVKDSLEAAIANFANENQSAEALKSGVELTLRQLTSAFAKSNLVDIAPVGEKFDPHKHQAISQIDAPEGTEPNTVLTVLQKGYALHDRVVRPALVVVAKAKT